MTWPRRPPEGPSARPCPSVKLGERRIAARRDQRRIVEFVAAHDATRIADRAFGKHASPRDSRDGASACAKLGRVAEQSRHRVPNAIRILEALRRAPCSRRTRRAPAASRRSARRPVAEARGSGEPSGMKLGIAARKPAAVAIIRWRLVGERREGNDLRAGRAASRRADADRRRRRPRPARARCAEPGGVMAAAPGPAARCGRAASLQDRIEIDDDVRRASARRSSRAARSACSAAWTSPRWRSGSARASSRGERAEHGHADAPRWRRPRQPTMPLAARPCSGSRRRSARRGRASEAEHDRGRRLRLARDVDHEQHRPGRIVRRARRSHRCGPVAPAMPSNRPITPSITSTVGVLAAFAHQRVEQGAAAWPSSRD